MEYNQSAGNRKGRTCPQLSWPYEDMKDESVMECTDYTGVEPRSSLNTSENTELRKERKTGYGMSREEKDILFNVKEEEGEGCLSVKMEREDSVKDEEGLWREQKKERVEQERDLTNQMAQTDRREKNGVKSECGQQEGELSTLVMSLLLKQPRVLIRRLEFTSISVPVSSPPHSLSSTRDQGTRFPWRRHELSPVRMRSLGQNGQVVTQKRKMISQLERSLKASSMNGSCAEAPHSSPAITPRNQDTGHLVEVSSQVFACSQCPFVHMEEVNLHQHIEKVHSEEHSQILRPLPVKDASRLTEGRRMEYNQSTGNRKGRSCPQLSCPYEDIKEEPRSSLNTSENTEERKERKTGYGMIREEKDILFNMKEEEGEGCLSVKMERKDSVKDEEGLWREPKKERVEQERDLTNQMAQTDRREKNGVKSECGQQEGELSTLVMSLLLKQPRVLIRRLEFTSISVPVSSPPHSLSSTRDQGTRFPWRRHELSPVRMRSLGQNGQVVTQKRKMISQLERSLKASSMNGSCAEAPCSSPAITPRNQDTGHLVEVSQVFACSQCPFVHMEEVNLHQHIEKIHSEEHSQILRSGGNPAGSTLLPSSTHQHPTPPKTLPTLTQSHTGTPGAHICSQCGTSFRSEPLLKKTPANPYRGVSIPLLPLWEEFQSVSLPKETPADSHRGEVVPLCTVWEEFQSVS
ncbi:hypothetical protein AAFF_G00272850 [Aldrovandia affinis]|uniref:C2H2-type domain-containing protein n=1 Tax=Aldrovandia affinis TaxID=143900 RepID=A0AAD7W1H5_9TELE|nr:hypothetical protein AAFF_G00272850 [Aldrovandia affinis]